MNEKKMTVNPMWVLFLGACPALGATGTLRGAAAMGITVLAVMLLTALVMALLRRILPERAVIAATILTAALFTSAAQLVLHAVLPSVYKMLGVYLAVAAVNLLVFSRSAGSASGLCVGKVVVTGLEFLAVIAVVALLRELFRSRHRMGTGDRLPQGTRRGFAPEAHGRLPGICHRRRDRQRPLPRRVRCGGRARLRRCRRRYSRRR